MSRCIIRTYKVAVSKELYPLCEELNKTAARIYNKTLSLLRKIKEKKGFWLSASTSDKYILRWSENINIHSQSKQALVQQYFNALKSYFQRAKKGKNAKPPYKTRRFTPMIWKESAIKLLQDGTIKLSLGKNREPFVVKTTLSPTTKIRFVRLVYENSEYYLHLAIEVQIVERKTVSNKFMSVDLGILRPITCFDGEEIVTYHGGVLNSILRYRNKRLADIQSAISRCKKDSKRYKKLVRAKKRFLLRISRQINDVLHKITSNFVGKCNVKSVSTIVVGDITGIRENVEGNDVSKQKIHQWCFRKLTNMIEYKAQLYGIKVVKISEAYTSKTCPVCGARNDVKGRNYKCSDCGFEYHRDGVGAINIWKRYLGNSQVVVGLAPTRGVRFNYHLCGYGVSTSPRKVALSY